MGSKKEAIAKKYKVRISVNALQNIGEITGYTAFVNQQPLNATRIGDKIFKVIDSLAANPFAYRECSELPTKTRIYRRALCLSWSIIFRIEQNEIIVLGIIHQSRKPAATRTLRKVK